MKLTFEIEPVQQARPRATRTRFGIRLYDPPKTSAFKKQLGAIARMQYHDEPLLGPLRVKTIYYIHIKKSATKKERRLMLSGAIRPTVKPDLDNFIKSCYDSLNGILWEDDKLIVEQSSAEYYSENPRIEIEVIELGKIKE